MSSPAAVSRWIGSWRPWASRRRERRRPATRTTRPRRRVRRTGPPKAARGSRPARRPSPSARRRSHSREARQAWRRERSGGNRPRRRTPWRLRGQKDPRTRPASLLRTRLPALAEAREVCALDNPLLHRVHGRPFLGRGGAQVEVIEQAVEPAHRDRVPLPAWKRRVPGSDTIWKPPRGGQRCARGERAQPTSRSPTLSEGGSRRRLGGARCAHRSEVRSSRVEKAPAARVGGYPPGSFLDGSTVDRVMCARRFRPLSRCIVSYLP